MDQQRPPAGIVFDAYGTLLDVASLAGACEARFPGRGAELARLWRQRQLEYSWLRTLMGRHATFWELTAASLSFACAAMRLPADGAAREELLRAYLSLAPFPEVPAALERLAGHRRLVLSNGTPEMLEAGLASAGLRPHLEAVLSAERVGLYKPAPQVYALAAVHLGCAPGELLFVSANGWDIAGAASFGLRTCWLNRAGAPVEELGQLPGMVVAHLGELAEMLA